MITDKLIFNRIKNILGGKVRLMLTTGTPLSAEILKFMKICFCVDICEAYGTAETGPVATMSSIGDNRTGEQGGPLQNVKLKLKDLPELNFMSSNDPPQGEIYMWGPGIAKTYFKNEELTAEKFEDGWFKTGDVGEIMENGSVRVISKISQIFNLKSGKQVIPCQLEKIFVLSEFITQAYVFGSVEQEYIIAFIVVADHLIPVDKSSEFDPDLKKKIFEDLMRISD